MIRTFVLCLCQVVTHEVKLRRSTADEPWKEVLRWVQKRFVAVDPTNIAHEQVVRPVVTYHGAGVLFLVSGSMCRPDTKWFAQRIGQPLR